MICFLIDRYFESRYFLFTVSTVALIKQNHETKYFYMLISNVKVSASITNYIVITLGAHSRCFVFGTCTVIFDASFPLRFDLRSRSLQFTRRWNSCISGWCYLQIVRNEMIFAFCGVRNSLVARFLRKFRGATMLVITSYNNTSV